MGSKQAKSVCRVLAVDDHPAVRESLRIILSRPDGFHLVGSASDGSEGIEQAHALQPQLIIMDVNMPKTSGVDAVREIRRFDPKVKILFYSGFPSAAQPALVAGANGFICKGAPVFVVRLAATLVLQGGVYVDEVPWQTVRPRAAIQEVLTAEHFNEEERAVSDLLKTGLSTKEIAALLEKSPRRVEKVRAHLMARLDAKNATSLVLKLAGYGGIACEQLQCA